MNTNEKYIQEYINYCMMQPQGTTPITFEEFIIKFKLK